MRLVLMTAARQATTEVLPALGLLGHQVRVVAPELSSLLDGDSGDVVLVDARYDLIQARTLCGLLSSTGVAAALVAVLSEGGLVALSADWGVDDVLLDTAVGRQRDQAALGQDGDQCGGDPGGGEETAQRAGLDEVVAGVDEDDVTGVTVEQAGQLRRDDAHLVAEQPQRGQDLRGGLTRRSHEHESHVVSLREAVDGAVEVSRQDNRRVRDESFTAR